MIPDSDLQKYQQAINGITAAQSELSPEELSAFSALISLLNNGNFEANESGGYIRVMKNALPQHAKNRLLQVHLKNFVVLSEKYFKTQATTPTGAPQTNTSGKAKSSGSSSMQLIIVAGIILAVGYFVVKDSDWFNDLFSGGQEAPEQVEEIVTAIDENVNRDEQSKQEIIIEQSDKQSAIPGKFPEASERLLTASDLQNLSKNDLKIMRNEIFARHGYIFQTNEMKTYFKYQDWYSPQYNNVNSMLTSIEQQNIELIKRYE